MTNKKNIIMNIIKVSASNIIKLIAGVLVGFLLPKIIGVDDYGYYKIFTLYAGYVGLFHFGIADGIYLKYGGKDYNQLEKEEFRYYSKFFILLEIIVSVVLMLVSICILKGEYRFIFVCVAIYLIAINITSYYQFISQITNRFSELSFRNVISSFLTISILLILLVLKTIKSGIVSYRMYVSMYVFIMIILAVWYMKTYRDITFGQTAKLKLGVIIEFLILGFPLMLSSLCSSLVFTLDRQFVSLLYDIDTYAIYAFAYSMMNLVTTAVSSISMVLYPTLKRIDASAVTRSYHILLVGIQILSYGCIIVYYPLNIFVKCFLPQYIGSLDIFRIIFPGIAISGAVTIVMHNYYKVLGWNKRFFLKSVLTLIISLILNIFAHIVFHTTKSISVASVITLLIWYIVVEYDLVKIYRIAWKDNFIYLCIMTFLFYTISEIQNIVLSGCLYLIIFLFVTQLFYRKEIAVLLGREYKK